MDIEQQRENNRKIAEINCLAVTSSRNRLLEEHSAAFRWLMASLLAINSAGLLVLKDELGSMSVWTVLAGISFYLGIVSALAIAWFAQRVVIASLPSYMEQIAFWSAVYGTGDYDTELHQEILKKPKDAVEKSKIAPLAARVSLLAFTIGLVFIGIAASKTSDSSKGVVTKKTSVSAPK